MRPKRISHKAVITIGIAVWVAALSYGFKRMVSYSMTPGAAAVQVTSSWPEGLPFERAETGDSLIVTLHPECSCSEATVSELTRIVSLNPGLKVFAVFEDYDTLPEKAENSDLWKAVAAIPGSQSFSDATGRIAALLGSRTSGEIRLFTAAGQLIFRGGITGSRGHAGSNPGSDALLALLSGETTTPQLDVPTFGCSLDRSN